VDASLDFSNFTPKKIRAFTGEGSPNIVDAAFGWHHEAYIDSEGQLHVCAKAKVTSIKVEELPNGERKLTQVKLPPGSGKASKVTFTRKRMFVCTDTGKLFSFKIVENARTQDEMLFHKSGPKFDAELIITDPILIKELENVKNISAG
jgi:alpha-tubulin suppressor-like RCC1 family protein